MILICLLRQFVLEGYDIYVLFDIYIYIYCFFFFFFFFSLVISCHGFLSEGASRVGLYDSGFERSGRGK